MQLSRVFSVLFISLATSVWAADAPSPEERSAQHRNLGKAFYENPTTKGEAVAEFQEALKLAPNSNREKVNYGLALLRAGKTAEAIAQLKEVQQDDPKVPHTWFNLGIQYKKDGQYEQAIVQFEHMAALVPEEPITHYQLGTLYQFAGRTKDALAQFERSVQLDPRLAAARFQLYNIYRQAGRQQDAARTFAIFQELKKQAQGAAIPEDVDWSNYAEIYDPPIVPAQQASVEQPAFEEHILKETVDSKTAGIAVIDSTGTGQIDLLIWSSRGIDLYRKGLERATDSGLGGITGVIFVAQGDFDNDGLIDLCILTEAGPLLYRNTKGKFARYVIALPQRRFERAVWIDYDHDYDLDLILLGDSAVLVRNEGKAGLAEHSTDIPFVNGRVTDAFKLRVVPDSKAFDFAVFYADHAPVLYRDQLGGKYISAPFEERKPESKTLHADFDNDGLEDFAEVTADGKIYLRFNRNKSKNRWIRVQLQGIRNLKLAQDAEIEIKAGTLYYKQLYAGVPLVFDLRTHDVIDTVRITWPNGLIQNEIKQATNQSHTYKEAQRLSGSCPMVWTWNGQQFQFITDVLGVAPLGASDGDGSYFPVDHDEYVSIPATALAPINGQYDIRLTEELSEVAYLDQIRLYAIDYPSQLDIFTNEKFKGAPFPEFRLFGVNRRVYPTSAVDDTGNDVLSRLLSKDQTYPDQFARSQLGVAEQHALELDFGQAAPSGRAVLLLNGWVDWPDGSTFRASAQDNNGLIMPYLQMLDEHGNWKTVNEDMGMPAGKPKTMAVDLHFISASRKVRIVTSLCVYWDEIFLSENTSYPETFQRSVPLVSADLHFRGFSESRIDPERKQPDTFFYDNVSSTSFWNPTPGLYTRYGGVSELIGTVDDRFVIMGSGDELRLRFDADALPPLAHGWKRAFLLKVDGWAKDSDPNTAFSRTVEPLPFHGMSSYPYPANERFPYTASHEQYLEEYNTRPALRLIRSLREQT